MRLKFSFIFCLLLFASRIINAIEVVVTSNQSNFTVDLIKITEQNSTH